MKILMDIGNSRIKWTLMKQGVSSPVRINDHSGTPPDDLLEALNGEISEYKGQGDDSRPGVEIWAASVCGQAMQEALSNWALEQHAVQVNWPKTKSSQSGVVCAYPEPEKMGVDRWLALVAAWARYESTLCVVDAGTALTIDVVDEDGRHQGGVIAPGVNAMQKALGVGTAMEFNEACMDYSLLADNTEGAICSGTLGSAIALIDKISHTLPRGAGHRVITGGESILFREHLDDNWQHVPDLVLEGLARTSLQNEIDI